MPRAVILSAVRTPVGRRDGSLSGVRPDDLAGAAIEAAVERAGVPAAEIEEMVSEVVLPEEEGLEMPTH